MSSLDFISSGVNSAVKDVTGMWVHNLKFHLKYSFARTVFYVYLQMLKSLSMLLSFKHLKSLNLALSLTWTVVLITGIQKYRPLPKPP